MQKITPNLWFDSNAEEAVDYYLTIFKDSKKLIVTRYGKEGFEVHKKPAGTVLTVSFQLEGQNFLALNGGPAFKLSEAVSFIINCKDQAEIDYYWDKLTAGGDVTAQQCGWLKDKFGLSWQVVPTILEELIGDNDPVKAGRVMTALLPMKKLDVAALQKAYDNK